MSANPQTSSSSRRELHVDAMRGIAASMVALFHFSAVAYEATANQFQSSIFRFGWLGVHVFFVISGYVVASLALRADSAGPGEFVARRLMRLYPPYLLAVALTIFVTLLAGMTPAYRGPSFVLDAAGLTCHLTLGCELAGLRWFDPVYWTLAIEVQFYVLAALVMAASRLLGPWSVWVACAAGLALGTYAPAYVAVHFAGVFVLGIALKAYKSSRLSALQLGLVAAAAVASMVVALQPGEVIASVVAFACLMLPWRRVPRQLVWLGTISYSLYLIHLTIGGRLLNLAFRLDRSVAFAVVAVCVAFIASVVASSLFWRVIERRAIEWSRRPRAMPLLEVAGQEQD